MFQLTYNVPLRKSAVVQNLIGYNNNIVHLI